jgi:hypothetical protein
VVAVFTGHPARHDRVGADLPVPTAEVEGSLLRLWFGDREHPALELEPIDLAELV